MVSPLGPAQNLQRPLTPRFSRPLSVEPRRDAGEANSTRQLKRQLAAAVVHRWRPRMHSAREVPAERRLRGAIVKFNGPKNTPDPDEKPAVEKLAALSLDQALKYMAQRHDDFIITKARCVCMVAMLARSPLD